jgi:hypothetical protein
MAQQFIGEVLLVEEGSLEKIQILVVMCHNTIGVW